MPLTIKPSNIKYKNPSTGEYENINSVAEKSSAEMVADINAAGQIKINSINSTGNSYISQIQAKGIETLNSIPVDYTNLNNEVTDLKSAFNSEHIADSSEIESWENGTIKADTGGNSNSSSVCRTPGYLSFDTAEYVIFNINSDYYISFREYTSESSSGFIGIPGSGWKEGSYQLKTTPGHFYRICIKLKTGSSLVYSDIPAHAVTYLTYKPTDTGLTLANKAADAKVTGQYISALDKRKNLVNKTLIPMPNPVTKRPTIGSDGYLYKQSSDNVYAVSHGLGISVTTPKKFSFGFMCGQTNNDRSGLKTGEKYTVTFDARYRLLDPENTTSRNITIYLAEKDSEGTLPNPNDVNTSSASQAKGYPINKGVTTEETLFMTFELAQTTTKFGIYVKANYDDSEFVANDFIELRNIRLYEGEKPMAWEPSLEDVLNVSNNVDDEEMTVKLQQLKRKTRISGSTFGTMPLCLIHFSDIHADQYCLERVLGFKNKYSVFIDDIIHTGDTVDENYSEGIDFWTNTEGAGNILNCIGNHDSKNGGSWTGATMAECYTQFFSPFISKWGATYTANETYYYKDYTTNKVRLIVLDIMHQTDEQLSWFASTLASAITAELDVIVAVHSRASKKVTAYDSVWDDKSIVNYPEDWSGGSYPQTLAEGYAEAVDTFIANGGYFIAWIHGHTHYKILAKLTDHQDQLNVAVANAGFAHTNTYIWERVANTKSADDFNVIAIDTTSKIFRVAKIGVDYDVHMRHVDTFSYNYGTHTLLYNA